MTTVYLDFEGVPTPVQKLAWYFMDAQERVYGVALAEYSITQQDAHETMTSSAKERAKELKDGITIHLGLRGSGDLWERFRAYEPQETQ